MNKLTLSTLLLALISIIPSHADDFAFTQGLPKADRIDQQRGEQLIQRFRNFRYNSGFALDFALKHFSQRSNGQTYNGKLFTSWNDQGIIARALMWPSSESPSSPNAIALLIQNGPNPQMWIKKGSGPVTKITDDQLFQPFYQDIVYTPFDLSIRFLYWDNFKYFGPGRERSRAAQIFTMSPPPQVQKAQPNLKEIKMAMDEKYNILLQAKYFDTNNNLIKSLIVNSFKQVQGQFIIKEIDVTDSVNKAKTRFDVLAAAMNVEVPTNYLTPEALNSPLPLYPADYYTVIGN